MFFITDGKKNYETCIKVLLNSLAKQISRNGAIFASYVFVLPSAFAIHILPALNMIKS